MRPLDLDLSLRGSLNCCHHGLPGSNSRFGMSGTFDKDIIRANAIS